jgi:hypothetical protein
MFIISEYLNIARDGIKASFKIWVTEFSGCEITQKELMNKPGYFTQLLPNTEKDDVNTDVIRVAGKACNFQTVLHVKKTMADDVKVIPLSIVYPPIRYHPLFRNNYSSKSQRAFFLHDQQG